MKEELVTVGKTLKVHHLKGAIKVNISTGYREAFKNGIWVFVDLHHSKVPFLLQGVQWDGETAILSFADLQNREEAEQFCGYDLLMQNKDLVGLNRQNDSGLELLVGFKAFTSEGALIGSIEAVEEYPEQIMATVLGDVKVHLIPLNEAFVEAIFPAERKCVLNLPEGLLDL